MKCGTVPVIVQTRRCHCVCHLSPSRLSVVQVNSQWRCLCLISPLRVNLPEGVTEPPPPIGRLNGPRLGTVPNGPSLGTMRSVCNRP